MIITENKNVEKKSETFWLYFCQKSLNHYEDDYESNVFSSLSWFLFSIHDFQIFHNEYVMMMRCFHMQISCRVKCRYNDLSIYRYASVKSRCNNHSMKRPGLWSLPFSKLSPEIIDLKEEKEGPVRSMIEYLYTTDFTVEGLKEFKDKKFYDWGCVHKYNHHSFEIGTCFLQPYAFIVDVYTLGDKYDIPGLRAKACAHLKERFDSDQLDVWHDDIAIWEYTYQHSRKSDELREVLVNKIAK